MSTSGSLQPGPFTGRGVTSLAEGLRDGAWTVPELVDQALDAAESLGGQLSAFVTVDRAGARDAAQRAQDELDVGVDRGVLHGIPVAVKDLIDTAGVRTTYGSRHFEDHVPVRDAAVVQRLRQAGCVVIGKTTTHEFAYGSTGDRGVGTPTRNPHDLALMSGGSSAGSGAAVGAGIVPIALGTDTGGSVRIPTALCGGHGLRPTTGSVPGEGVLELSGTMDVVGPMASGLDGLAALWDVMRADVPVARAAGHGVDVHPAPRAVGPFRFLIPECELTSSVAPGVQAVLTSVTEALAGSGWTCEPAPAPVLDEAWGHYAEVQGPEAFAVHARRVERHPELFDPEVLERLLEARTVPGWLYVRALRERPVLSQALAWTLGEHDGLILPTVPIEAPPVGARDGDFGGGWRQPRSALLSLCGPFSYLGWPALSLSVPRPGKLPGSVQLVVPPGHEDRLLGMARAVEEVLIGA